MRELVLVITAAAALVVITVVVSVGLAKDGRLAEKSVLPTQCKRFERIPFRQT